MGDLPKSNRYIRMEIDIVDIKYNKNIWIYVMIWESTTMVREET